MRLFLVLTSLLCGLAAHAEGKRNFIVFEVRSHRGVEQSSYSWDDHTLTYVTNSNFTQGSPDRAILGVFRRPLDDSLKRELAELLSGTKAAKAGGRAFAHSIQVKVNGAEIAPGAPAYDKLVTWAAGFSHDSWVSEDGLEVRLDPKGKAHWKALSPKLAHGPVNLSCTQESSEQYCRATPYGYVSFKTQGGR